MKFFNWGKKEARSAEVASDVTNPHKEEKNDACTDTSNGIALYNRIMDLKGYSALTQSAFFSAVNLISNSVAQMSWELKAYDDTETDQEFIRSILNRSDLTQFMLVKGIIKDCIMHGNGFAYVHRDSKGNAISLEYVPFGECTIEYNPFTKIVMYRAPYISSNIIEPVNMIHLRMITDNGFEGKPIVAYANNIVKLNGAAEKSAQEFFSSGMRVQGVLSTDQPNMTDKQRKAIEASWAKSQFGGGNGMAVLEAGFKYDPISSNTKDAQLLETRLFNVQEIARFFNMSPTLLGDLSKSSYNTLEASQQAFVLNSLMPYVIMLEQELNDKLLSLQQKKLYYIDIKEEDIIKSDKQSQASYLTTLVNAGLLTRNEARKELGFGPIEGGDVLTVSYTDVNQNTIGENNEDKDKNKEEENEEQ